MERIQKKERKNGNKGECREEGKYKEMQMLEGTMDE